MLLFLGGILAFLGFSFAQNANLLEGRVGVSSTIAYYGPYFLGNGSFWVALVEPENVTYVLSPSELVEDRAVYEKVLETHNTRVFASQNSGLWRYYSRPARLSLGAGSLLLGFAETLVPFAFDAEKVLVGSVAGVFLPSGFANASIGVVAASEEAVVAAIGVQRDDLELRSMGWDARLALDKAGKERSYAGALEYFVAAERVVDGTVAFGERLGGFYGKAARLVSAVSGLGAGFFAYDVRAAELAFRDAGAAAERGLLEDARSFCAGPLPALAESCRKLG